MRNPPTYVEPASPAARLGRFLSRAAKLATGGMPLSLYAGLLLGAAVVAFGTGMPLAGVLIGSMIGMYGAAGLRGVANRAMSAAPETDAARPRPVNPITSMRGKEWTSVCAAFSQAGPRAAASSSPRAPDRKSIPPHQKRAL